MKFRGRCITEDADTRKVLERGDVGKYDQMILYTCMHEILKEQIVCMTYIHIQIIHVHAHIYIHSLTETLRFCHLQINNMAAGIDSFCYPVPSSPIEISMYIRSLSPSSCYGMSDSSHSSMTGSGDLETNSGMMVLLPCWFQCQNV